jgi:Aminotransferase class I and II/Bacterial regulatory proteins, gntR family
VPPSRALAEGLGYSRWVVTEAYGQLIAEGYLCARVGSATRVSWVPDTAPPRPRARRARARPIRYDLAPGLPDLRAFPRRRWADAVRAVTGSAVHYDLGLPDPAGHAVLRTTLAQYLRRSRGADAHAASVTVCAGITDGLVRTCRALRAEGIADLAVEDPGWRRLRDAAISAGLRVHPVPVDHDGLRVDDLARTPARAVVVGAAHQFPTGTVLSPARRARLVRWAREVDGFVIEDDYDAEFRYDHHPVAVMQGMDPGRVFLLGSVSKTLSPALGLGWLVAPAAVTRRCGRRTSSPPRHRFWINSRSPPSSTAGGTTPTCGRRGAGSAPAATCWSGRSVHGCRTAGSPAPPPGCTSCYTYRTVPTPARRSGPRPPPGCAWRTSVTTARSGRRSTRSSSGTATSATRRSPRPSRSSAKRCVRPFRGHGPTPTDDEAFVRSGAAGRVEVGADDLELADVSATLRRTTARPAGPGGRCEDRATWCRGRPVRRMRPDPGPAPRRRPVRRR